MIAHLRMIHFALVLTGAIVLYAYFSADSQLNDAIEQHEEIVSVVNQVSDNQEYSFPFQTFLPSDQTNKSIAQWLEEFMPGKTHHLVLTAELIDFGIPIKEGDAPFIAANINDALLRNIGVITNVGHDDFSDVIEFLLNPEEDEPEIILLERIIVSSGPKTVENPSTYTELGSFKDSWNKHVRETLIPRDFDMRKLTAHYQNRVFDSIDKLKKFDPLLAENNFIEVRLAELFTVPNMLNLTLCKDLLDGRFRFFDDFEFNGSSNEEFKINVDDNHVFCAEISDYEEFSTITLKFEFDARLHASQDIEVFFEQSWNTQSWVATPFKQAFPELSNFASNAPSLEDIYLDELGDMLAYLGAQTKGNISLFGLSVNQNYVAIWGPAIFMSIYLYFIIHLRAFEKFAEKKVTSGAIQISTPWVILYNDSRLVVLLSCLSLGLLPALVTGAPLTASIIAYRSFGESTGTFLFGAAIFTATLISSVNVFFLLKRLWALDYEFVFEDSR